MKKGFFSPKLYFLNHEFGIYEKTAANNPDISAEDKAYIPEQLTANFNGEFGAIQGKFGLAACAKKNGLDAIHDTVHEMAKDEARHG